MSTLYETIKNYGTGKGEGMMWRSVGVISEAVDKYFSDEQKDALMSDIYGLMSGGHYNEEHAHRCVEKMYYLDAKGEKHYAPYWTEPQVHEVYDKVKAKLPKEYNPMDYFVTFHMLASDNWTTIHDWWPDITPEGFAGKIADLSVAWLADADWPTTSKIWDYMHSKKRA